MHSGPRMMSRLSSSCPRCQARPVSGVSHRQQVMCSPLSMWVCHVRRSRWKAAPYPRSALVPRALSRSRVWVGHRVASVSSGQPGSAQTRLAMAGVAVHLDAVAVAEGWHWVRRAAVWADVAAGAWLGVAAHTLVHLPGA